MDDYVLNQNGINLIKLGYPKEILLCGNVKYKIS